MTEYCSRVQTQLDTWYLLLDIRLFMLHIYTSVVYSTNINQPAASGGVKVTADVFQFFMK